LTAATEKALPKGSGEGLVRWYRPLAVALMGFALVWGVFTVWVILTDQARFGPPGFDRDTYMAATGRWLGGGSFYDPVQLAGPYPIWAHAILYPPLALALFVPFSLLPAVLWWAVPITVILAVIAYHRPAYWAWPLVVGGLAWPPTVVLTYTGNPGLWVAAGVAAGTVLGWPALAVILKPTLAPFILVGVRRRSWWIGAAVVGLVALAFGSLWLDWWKAVTNIYGARVGLLYSMGDVPLLAAPVIAAAARRRPGSDS
jgi:hypothetical protein